jgi:hypothetical protein
MLFPYCGPVMHHYHELLEICVFEIPRLDGSYYMPLIWSYWWCSCFEYRYLVRTGLAQLVMVWMPEDVQGTPKRDDLHTSSSNRREEKLFVWRQTFSSHFVQTTVR